MERIGNVDIARNFDATEGSPILIQGLCGHFYL